MKKIAAIALIAAALGAIPSAVFAGEAADGSTAQVEIKRNAMLYNSEGKRLARVYDITRDGDPQVILNSKLYTIPASTLSIVNDKLTTSLSKRDITSD